MVSNLEKAANKTQEGWLKRLDVSSNFRYERKFTALADSKKVLLHTIRQHPAIFRPIFHARQINNIYFDTPQLRFYNENQWGIANRIKVRIRWYGDTFGEIHKPKLEFKIKRGGVGDKWTFRLPSFVLEKGCDTTFLQTIFQSADLPEPILSQLKALQPTLVNTYLRSYFLSADKKYRLTLDDKLCYYKINRYFNHFNIKQYSQQKFIVELKYALADDQAANRISQHFPFRLDKNSKYVTGIDMFR